MLKRNVLNRLENHATDRLSGRSSAGKLLHVTGAVSAILRMPMDICSLKREMNDNLTHA